ncbi:MAG: NAD(P)-dependent oxidoreductase [Chloroflexi bacterium]|nr:NAD(P)-dependent oxidoreductase [Chloroflexota bacterium]MXX82249.1 NAD(P)-dependent oxidoreductase [Chloroflexota bacterium]MYA93193.1 NAD(P)-dependent oxidoreductase [Chloroflexota bacterium]MYC55321.1 NAD(P)-dependent oxidoreductase [Chloroflexota bacterium]MYD39696.1 NAD(P)-dependent oxidoreductase [Chloroflexota bacterium]
MWHTGGKRAAAKKVRTMAEQSDGLSVLVTGGDSSAGLAAVKALTASGHRTTATARNAAGALAIRQLGALAVFPDLQRASEISSSLRMVEAEAVLHASAQVMMGVPQIDIDHAGTGARILAETQAVASAAAQHGIKRLVALSAGNPDDHLQAAESTLQASGLNGYILRAGYVYGGNSCATTALADMIKRSATPPSGAQPASWIHEDDLAAAMLNLLVSEMPSNGMSILSASDDSPCSPDDFAIALAQSLGLSAPRFAKPGRLARLRQPTARERLLAKANRLESRQLRETFGWSPRHASLESGLEATTLTWRLQESIRAADYYEVYDDAAAEAIARRESGEGLPAPVVEAPAPVQTAEASPAASNEAAPEPAKAAAPPPPSDGPTPWNEDEAKREERRRKALERRAKRAAKRARG